MWAAGKGNIRSSERARDLLLSTVVWGDSLISPVSVSVNAEDQMASSLPPFFSLRPFFPLHDTSRFPFFAASLPPWHVCVCVIVCGCVAGFCASSQTDWCMLTFSPAERKEMRELSSSSSFSSLERRCQLWLALFNTYARAHTNNSFPHRNIRIHIVYVCTRLSSSLLADRTESNAAHPRQ